MTIGKVAAFTYCVLLLSFGCGDDGGEPGQSVAGASTGGREGEPSSEGGAGGEATAGSDDCERGCAATLAADCDNGPASEEQCETDCRALIMGSCGGEYRSLQTCARGREVSCSAAGLPVVTECSDEQGAFVQCLN